MTKLREMAEKIVHGREPQSDLVTEVETALREVAEESIKIIEPWAKCTCHDDYTRRGRHESNACHFDHEDIIQQIKTRFGLGE